MSDFWCEEHGANCPDGHCICSGSPGDPDFTPAAACVEHGPARFGISWEQAQLERRKRERDERYQRALEACPAGALGTIILEIKRECEGDIDELRAYHETYVEASRQLHEAKVAELNRVIADYGEQIRTLRAEKQAAGEPWAWAVHDADGEIPNYEHGGTDDTVIYPNEADARLFAGDLRSDRDSSKEAAISVVPLYPRPSVEPIPMLMYCPRCGAQHIDAPKGEWTNPPHKTHTCQTCGARWRHCDAWPTTGVASLSDPGRDVVEPAPRSQDAEAIARWLDRVNDTEHTPRGYAAGYFAARIRVGDWKP